MKLSEAIEIQEKELAPMLVGRKIEWQEAAWLLIEAGKRLKEVRKSGLPYLRLPLPGETEE